MSAMIVTPTPFGAVMLDCLEPLSQVVLDACADYVLPGTRTGITLFGRYLENLTPWELNAIISHPARYGLLLIGESRPNGYIPSATDGVVDGAREVAKRRALSIPSGAGIVCDLEGMGGTGHDTTAYADAYAGQVQSAADQAIAYVGAGVPLNAAGLFALLDTLYWRSFSNVQQVAAVDYALAQVYPTQTLDLGIAAGKRDFDVSFIYRDKRMRAPMMVQAA